MQCLRFSLAWARIEMPVILIWVNLLQQDGMPLHHSPITLCKTLRKRTWCQARDRQANCGQPRNLQHKQHHAAPDPKPNSSHCLQHALNTLVQSWQEITIRLLQCPARTPNQANPELKGISHSTMFSHPRWSLGLLKIQLQRNAQLKVQKPVKNWTLLAMLLETLRCPHLFTEQSRDVNASLHLWLSPYLGALFPHDSGEHLMKILLKAMEGIEHTWAQLSSSRVPATRHQGGLG